MFAVINKIMRVYGLMFQYTGILILFYVSAIFLLSLLSRNINFSSTFMCMSFYYSVYTHIIEVDIKIYDTHLSNR